MALYDLLILAPMLVLLTWAAVHDVRTRRIPNLLNLVLFLTGLAVSLSGIGRVAPGQCGLGVLSGFGLTLPLFLLGAVGAGDVKIMTALGAWLGPYGILYVFLARSVIALPIVIGQAAHHGRLRVLFRNTALLTMGAAHLEQTGVKHFAEMGKANRSVEKSFVPWGVPVLLAAVLVVWLQRY